MIAHSKPDVGPEELAAVQRVLDSGRLAQGPEVAAFESECAVMLGRRYAVATNSGTAALHLALITLGIGDADPVALPSYACAALLQPILWQRAEPLLCDIGGDFNILPESVPASARAVVVPHLFGAPATLPDTGCLIEDIAQSMGGNTGKAGIVTITSFYATKLMTTGEGGMLLTDDAGLAELARDLRDYDGRDHFRVRYAYKMTEFQAAMGRVQLRRLPHFLARRRALAEQYTSAFAGLPLRTPAAGEHVYFRYVVGTPSAAALQAHLQARGVDAKRPVHHPIHHDLGGEFPQSDAAHERNLSLPMYPALSDEEIATVIAAMVEFHHGRTGAT